MDINKIKDNGLIKYLLENGGVLNVLEPEFDKKDYDSISCMNPSIVFADNRLFFNVRAVNYNLYNSDTREFNWNDQPVVYVNSSHTLTTHNYIGELDPETLEIKSSGIVHMEKNEIPKWHFIGLEDARLTYWSNKLHLIGVRRDTDNKGTGRMEISDIEFIDNKWTETNRYRIPSPEDSYCEKNWMPVLDRAYTFVRWTLPTEIVTYNIHSKELKSESRRFTLENNLDAIRGDSQLVWYNGYYWAIGHTCKLTVYDPNTRSRSGIYKHYILKFDKDLNLINISEPWSYNNDFSVEFGCGLAIKDNMAYISFAEDDSMALIIKFKADLLFK
jgi:hypothetical protein